MMPQLLNIIVATTLAAANRTTRDTLKAMRDGWARSPGLWWILPVVVAALLSLLVALWLYRRRLDEATDAGPRRLFQTIAAELGIAPADRRLLVRISHRQTLPSPLTLLLSPRTLRHHAAAFAAPLRRPARLRIARQVARLRRRLLGP